MDKEREYLYMTKSNQRRFLNRSNSSLADYAVPGPTQVPAWPEKEVGLWGADAPSAGSVLRGCTPAAALHH